MGLFKMPSLGADMDEGTLLEWLVKPGDAVHKGDVVAVIDTAKSAIDVEVFEDGFVRGVAGGARHAGPGRERRWPGSSADRRRLNPNRNRSLSTDPHHGSHHPCATSCISSVWTWPRSSAAGQTA